MQRHYTGLGCPEAHTAHPHATGPLPGPDAKSIPGAPSPPHSKQSLTDGSTPPGRAVCMALSSADFRKPEGEITHVGRQWGGRREVPTGACPPP